MARLSAVFLLLGLLGTNVVAEYNETLQNINADCDNGCFFGSFPGGSCTNDAACMCDQQKYRETYFCCMAKKCASNVLPDSIQRQTLECEARNMPFTFDEEAACGISPSTSASPATVTVTVNGDSTSATVTTSASSTGSDASIKTVGLGAAGLAAVAGMLL
ncbi:hypothetical protein N7448_007023 [Penicillium atrosanguineum]|uniref:uncharacterized protein n=1 Tax=Penicillium atrosanguineum TaxID=1132637 RepID=UPI0023877638|nr:uncharacterized protein N7443_010783 [Penicillium atrosanguineum]KAJ5132865.1 hypothetical protein N7448_007023 [Penicillium atrosanguineum]KAJ5141248.1 hypothetical protein N7526_002243 [Penicillium atrosanguineum]KAJ5290530.1 hypothetical protein N7443_010783 [Penicillium atrosanguineum]